MLACYKFSYLNLNMYAMKTHITRPLNFLLATLTENHILVVFILKV